ncbi:ABC transporter substrate-binding protein [Natronorubrum daqingense]|uniref:ABC transporter substrate-binding protein n=1 Tax=Natronorubrum daqingense TaxID=588898 RepID=A0A1N6YCC3_9EURY|nr:ABC transporter substrate-binding protein [Natronorubrum daqingense]APX95711.1 ABC transporter substrate-binding protein [Natronorubrum daqingense]SIR12200.1 peptide/nickel transport system substrate-binding protein [Natronorubrum daqingense]
MNRTTTDPVDGVDRRSVLAAGAAGLSLSLSGCMDNVRSVVTGTTDDQLSLSIATVSQDDNRQSPQIARHIEGNLEAAGIDATIDMRSQTEFLEMVLIEQDYDMFVGLHPGDFDPDYLFEALHSTYADEPGWQNPYAYSTGRNFVDDLLEDQRRADDEQERQEILTDLLEEFVSEKPFEPICRPHEFRIGRGDRFDGWHDGHFATQRGYLGLEPTDSNDDNELEALITDSRPTQNINPLMAENRERETIIDLVYDSLGTVIVEDDEDGEDGVDTDDHVVEYRVEPWLAESWEWIDDEDGTNTAHVTLREDVTFHTLEEDETGEPLTAEDVEFTYQLLENTTLGQGNTSPAPRYQGHVSAVDVDGIEIENEYELRIPFHTSTMVGERAFTVPILPKHIWLEDELDERIGSSDDLSAPKGEWGLVTSSAIEPVGSGPYQFADQSDQNSLTLERFDDHFSIGSDEEDLLEPIVEELTFVADTGSASSVERIASGGSDFTGTMLEAYAIDDVPDDDSLETMPASSWTFYHLGFNAGRVDGPPFYDPQFRSAICRLVDKEFIAEEFFFGYADPIAVPVTDEWVPEAFEWDGVDPETPFAGSDGEVDVNGAISAFESIDSIDYRYDEDEEILRRN